MLKKYLSGWSNIHRSSPKLVVAARDILDGNNLNDQPRTVRGLGKAYGDAATLDGGFVAQTNLLDKILFIDKNRYIIF